jgi:hypothetical protein
MVQASVAIATALLLPVVLPIRRVLLAILTLVIRVAVPPFAPAVPAHLPVLGIRRQPALVVVASTLSLACRPGTDALLGTIGGQDEVLVAVRALVVACFHLLLPIPLTLEENWPERKPETSAAPI